MCLRLERGSATTSCSPEAPLDLAGRAFGLSATAVRFEAFAAVARDLRRWFPAGSERLLGWLVVLASIGILAVLAVALLGAAQSADILSGGGLAALEALKKLAQTFSTPAAYAPCPW